MHGKYRFDWDEYMETHVISNRVCSIALFHNWSVLERHLKEQGKR
jgi:hypothetical protein